ncbi:MAG: hypothetical protein R2822_08730 [Spirosomataceae bacterium]
MLFIIGSPSLNSQNKERKILKDQQITQLYIKFFDVDWDNTTQQAVPKAVIQFKEKPPLAVVPAVFVSTAP